MNRASRTTSVRCVSLLWLALACSTGVSAPQPFEIRVIEQGSRHPVPLVQLRATHNVVFVTDNNGLAAIDAPEILGTNEVYFEIASPGYEASADGFNYRGARVRPIPGTTAVVEIKRTAIARRIGRLTGAGLFAESQKLGAELHWRESGIVGCDSTQNAWYKGRLFWVWGDTSLARYPLGIFNASGATTDAAWQPALAGALKPPYNYFRNEKGEPRGVALIPGEGPTWMSAMATVTNRAGEQKLVATYAKIRPPLDAYEYGLAVWDDTKEAFLPHSVVWRKSSTNTRPPPFPDGHAAAWVNAGKAWLVFGNPLPRFQCPATFEDWQNTNSWQVLEPQKYFRSAIGGTNVTPHTGSIAYHPWRNKWLTVFMENKGAPSVYGELWYAEAKNPLEHWGPAVKVLSHQNYTFYNPKLHGYWASTNSADLLFEATYTIQFSDGKNPTPRYDYNQIMYTVDLNDPALAPAQRESGGQ